MIRSSRTSPPPQFGDCGVEDLREHGLVDVQRQRISVPQDAGGADVAAGQVRLQGPEVLRDIVIETEDAVTGAEPHLPGQVTGVDLVLVVAEVLGAPDAQDEDVHQDGEEEIEQDAACHDQQPLPGRFRPELPALGLFFHGFDVHGFINHPGDLAVAADRQPSDAVLCLLVFQSREQAGKPAALGAE